MPGSHSTRASLRSALAHGFQPTEVASQPINFSKARVEWPRAKANGRRRGVLDSRTPTPTHNQSPIPYHHSPPLPSLLTQAYALLPTLTRDLPVVYILRLRSGNPYIGASTDLPQRLQEHTTGYGGQTTRLDPPNSVLWIEPHANFAAARQREAQLKRWSRAKKESLVAGDLVTLKVLAHSRTRTAHPPISRHLTDQISKG